MFQQRRGADYLAENTIVADFVGYEAPDQSSGLGVAFCEIMEDRAGVAKAEGTATRLTLNLEAGRARLETIAAGPFEFLFISRQRAGQPTTGDCAIFAAPLPPS